MSKEAAQLPAPQGPSITPRVPSNVTPSVKLPDVREGGRQPVIPSQQREGVDSKEGEPAVPATVVYVCPDGRICSARVTAQPRPNILNLFITGNPDLYFVHDAEILNVPPNESETLPSLGTWYPSQGGVPGDDPDARAKKEKEEESKRETRRE